MKYLLIALLLFSCKNVTEAEPQPEPKVNTISIRYGVYMWWDTTQPSYWIGKPIKTTEPYTIKIDLIDETHLMFNGKVYDIKYNVYTNDHFCIWITKNGKEVYKKIAKNHEVII